MPNLRRACRGRSDARRLLAQLMFPNLLTIINNFNRTNKEHSPGSTIYSTKSIKCNTLSVCGSMCRARGNELWIGFDGGGKASLQGLRWQIFRAEEPDNDL